MRETIEVRDADGAARILRTLAEEHGPRAALDGILACCTDHRYGDGGHTLDFAVKCAELAEFLSGDADAAVMFTALVPQLVSMARLEETSAWRRPSTLRRSSRTRRASCPPPFRPSLRSETTDQRKHDVISVTKSGVRGGTLRRVLGTALTISLLSFGLIVTPLGQSQQTVVVVPFTNISGQPADD